MKTYEDYIAQANTADQRAISAEEAGLPNMANMHREHAARARRYAEKLKPAQVVATVYFVDEGRTEEETFTFHNEQTFLTWAKEELLWEGTERITCKALNYDEQGSYAWTRKAL